MSRYQEVAYRWYTKKMQSSGKVRRSNDLSDHFIRSLARVREEYHLTPQGFGVDTSNYLRPVKVRGNLVFATINRLEWAHFMRCEIQEREMLTFRMDMSIHVQKETTRGDQTIAEYEEVINVPVCIYFPDHFPSSLPSFAVDKERVSPELSKWRLGWDQGGLYICTLNQESSWRKGADNVLDAIDVMADWMGAVVFGEDGRREV